VENKSGASPGPPDLTAVNTISGAKSTKRERKNILLDMVRRMGEATAIPIDFLCHDGFRQGSTILRSDFPAVQIDKKRIQSSGEKLSARRGP
jgi:hypothetical protein